MMKRGIICFLIFFIILISVAGAAQENHQTPPAGKMEGFIRSIGGVYYIGGDPKTRVSYPGNVFYEAAENQNFVTFLRERDEGFCSLYMDAEHMDGEHSEDAIRISLVFMSGDESMREAFYSSGNQIGFNLSGIEDGASAIYHLEMESEHLWYSGDFPVSVERLPEETIALDNDFLTIY